MYPYVAKSDLPEHRAQSGVVIYLHTVDLFGPPVVARVISAAFVADKECPALFQHTHDFTKTPVQVLPEIYRLKRRCKVKTGIVERQRGDRRSSA